MKSVDVKAFRKANNLTQSEVGDYLGCTKAFISTIENGNRSLPSEMYSKLINNPLNWDVSMLTQPTSVITPMPIADGALVAELRAQIERLEGKIDYLNRELGEKEALLKMLKQGGEESARGAGISLSANAV